MAKVTKVINKSGFELDFDAAVLFMDDDVREQVHADLAPCTEQEFLTAYEKAHEVRFGEPWELSKPNPCW